MVVVVLALVVVVDSWCACTPSWRVVTCMDCLCRPGRHADGADNHAHKALETANSFEVTRRHLSELEAEYNAQQQRYAGAAT